ncbi:sensor histidine kinase [Luedemannella flava]
MIGRLRERVRRLLAPSGTLPPLSWRGQLFDALVALALLLAAVAQGDGGDSPQRTTMVPYVPEPLDPVAPPTPPVPPVPPAARPVPEPFLPIDHDRTTATVFVLALVVLPLVFRRRYPLAMLWVVLGTVPFVTDFDAVVRVSFYACVICAYTAAVYSPYWIPALVSVPVAALLYAGVQESAVPTVPVDAVPFLILIPIAVVASGLRRWKRRADALESEQAEALRRATEHERARIARELHDVVTHNVSVMVIQAGAARRAMDATPTRPARRCSRSRPAGARPWPSCAT